MDRFAILQIPAFQAQKMCDDYADEWGTGRHVAPAGATWFGAFEVVSGKLRGVLGYSDDAATSRRFILSWHVDSTRHGKLAARELLRYSRAALPAGWIELGTITPLNQAGRSFLRKTGWTEQAVVMVRRKEA